MLTQHARTISRVLSIGALSLAAGCHAHAQLEAPTHAAPEEERVEAYAKLRPLSYKETHVTTSNGFGWVSTERETDYLQLANGRRVYYPEDLLTVVPADSPAAEAANDSRSSRELGNGLQWGGIAAITAGAVVAIMSFGNTDEVTGQMDTTPFVIGLGISLAGVGLMSGAYFVRRDANDEAATAFETYEPSLRQRMNLCLDGERAHSCP